ncbi:MAG: TonB-dependent receptor [bacterium]|nr:TonB-dependent receptor [bacterium]
MSQLTKFGSCRTSPVWLGLLVISIALAGSSLSRTAFAADDDSVDVLALSLEDLVNMTVTTVSKKTQRLIDSASAVYVISAEDIRRSGMTSVPELLRLVPGINVARFSSSTWGVASRGASRPLKNDLLVMVDGRSVYTPLFGGTYWDIQSVTLEDIDRIEVIRGPGGTVWGANAVSGVINIIRKSASVSDSNFVSYAAGNEDRMTTSLRVHRKVGDAQMRVSGNFLTRDESHSPVRGDAGDGWRQGMMSYAMDWDTSSRDRVTLQGDWYSGKPNLRTRVDTATSIYTNTGQTEGNYENSTRGGNVLGRWTRKFSESASTQFQFYWDRRTREGAKLKEDRHTYDVDFQNDFLLGESHAITWGTGARLMLDDLETSINALFIPNSNEEVVYNGFIQDEVSLIPDELKLTLGTKTEWNSYTGWEFSPSLRMLWAPTETQQFWGAISRTVRTPSRAARELSILIAGVVANPFGPPAYLPMTVAGRKNQSSEYTFSYELGYRTQPIPSLSFDLATFYNVLENGSSFAASPTNPAALSFDNTAELHFYGGELAAQWQARRWARLKGSYTFFRTGRQNYTDAAPAHKFQIQSYVDLPWDLELDSWLSYYGRTDSPTTTDTDMDSRWRLDVRLGWKPMEQLELSLVGQNLLHDEVEELDSFTESGGTGAMEVERSFYAKATWRF